MQELDSRSTKELDVVRDWAGLIYRDLYKYYTDRYDEIYKKSINLQKWAIQELVDNQN